LQSHSQTAPKQDNEQAIIQLNDVDFSYNKISGNSSESSLILQQVNLSVFPGDFVSIIGPNGGGKSTLMKLILGLLKPDAGSVSVLGVKPVKARRRLGYMPQHLSFDQQFPVSVLDVVLMGLLHRRSVFRYNKAEKAQAHQALQTMGVADEWNEPFHALSGGQKQRVLIARAIVHQPEILLLDEPTANVDPAGEEQFYEILSELNQRMTILIISHDLGFVSKRVERVVCVNQKVALHPVSQLTGEMIQQIYGHDMSLVHHDHCCNEAGQEGAH